MSLHFDKDEAIRRMKQRGTNSVRWTLKKVTVEWKYIPATEARNWDGSSAGSGQDPNHKVLQMMTWHDGGQPRFSNYW